MAEDTAAVVSHFDGLIRASKRWADCRAFVILTANVLILACSGQTPSDGAPLDDSGLPDAADADVEVVLDTSVDVALDSPDVDAGRDPSGEVIVHPDDVGSDAVDVLRDPDAEVEEDADVSVDPWRSTLFPVEWEPHTSVVDSVPGLADYSYAGYAAGLREEGAPPSATVFDVIEFGLALTVEGAVDPDADNTDAIQSAIDAASVSGGVVQLPPGLIRVDGTLQVNADQVVIRGAGSEETRLLFTAHEGMSFRAGLTVGTAPRLGSALPLVADAANGSFEVRVAPDADVDVGEELALGLEITDGFVERHGMTGTWGPFNGSWQPFAWRTVVDTRLELLDDVPHALVLTLDVPLREPHRVEDRAAARVVSGQIRECGVEDLSISNAVDWDAAWLNDQVHAIAFRGVRDGWVRNVRSFVSPLGSAPESLYSPHLQSSGLLVVQSRHVTVRDVHLANSQHRGGGGNGYLFEIRQSNEVLTADSTGERGRHNFIQNWGFGTSGCVWLRIHSSGSAQTFSPELPVEIPAASEFHHSLATANLIDESVIDDGWFAENRRDWSSGAGVTAWRNVLWNTRGRGEIRSMQWGVGYVIGTAPTIRVRTSTRATAGLGTEPEDWVEGEGAGDALEPSSLYEAQLARRLALMEE